MKRLPCEKLINIFSICLIFCLLTTSCNHKKNAVAFEQTVTFENSNWDFTHRTLEFDANITDTISPYRIEVELKYGPDDERVDEMPVSFSVTAPDGAKSSVPAAFLFKDEENDSEIAATSAKASQSQYRVLYEKKYFNCSGVYHFRLNRHSEKFDNYNIQSLTLRVVKI